MKKLSIFLVLLAIVFACTPSDQELPQEELSFLIDTSYASTLAAEVKNETARTWEAYRQYAWGHDVLAPLSKSYKDWYAEPLYISPIDAYSTLHLMGMKKETAEIERYVVDSLNFDKNIDAKIFEVNIRILGGLLAMYGLSENPQVLAKARDFADRMLPAFDTPTGIPTYWVNLKTGEPRGDTVNVAEAATYTMEMGVLSYYTQDPKYYQAGKKATLAIFDRRSEIGLIGDVIDVQTGEWVRRQSHICAGVDSYYEYLYKSYLLFGDPELKKVWEESIPKVHQYLAEEHEGNLWYARANMDTGEKESAVVTLYDAFFPALMALSGDVERGKRHQTTWQWLWNQYGLEPMVYDYKAKTPNYPVYDLNPEIIESAYYLYHITSDSTYFHMNESFWSDIKKYCGTNVAFTSVQDVQTMEKKDYMPTFFLAETLKYFYLTFSHHQGVFDFDDHVFNTEAHQFKRSAFDKTKAKEYLGY